MVSEVILHHKGHSIKRLLSLVCLLEIKGPTVGDDPPTMEMQQQVHGATSVQLWKHELA